MNYIAGNILLNYDLLNDEELSKMGFEVMDDVVEDVFWIFWFVMEDLNWKRVMNLGNN